PMYRQFSRALVDAGANIVAGTHAHCVQGGEKYKDGYIVYGLGNFFMPHHLFVGAELSYPEFANLQLALEWDPSSGNAVCHWIEYQYGKGNHSLHYLGSEAFEESGKLKDYSPFTGMSDREYIEYYRKFRRKKLLIPVYTDYRKVFRNNTFTRLLKCRASFARVLAKLKLISWQN
ncbi:MAG: CapA family protein, partial [Bacteroidota bacterium]|nr:CapA family protein [Bacteroidota bacterium]